MIDFKKPFSTNGIQSNGVKSEISTEFCLVCKLKTNNRFKIAIKDSKINNIIKANICRDCFNSFIGSYHDENVFTISKLLNRGKHRFGEMRI